MERIGEYFVRRLIGEGGMGKVYEAEERLSRRKVALKVLRPELGRSEEGRQMFLNEMTILAHLDHPNVVRSLACSEVDGQLVMALEFLEGQTLRECLAARGRLPWPEAVSIASQVAAALAAAHGQEPPIIHRDLKPENLMIVGGGRIVVMDFGIAKVLQAIRKSTTHSVGTLQYMSPEQIDAAEVDRRSDIYCLGLILYEALAGHPPFHSDSPRELLNLQCTAPPPPLAEEIRAQLPRGVERALHAMLEKAPARRPASAGEVSAALDPFVSAADDAAASSASMSMSMPMGTSMSMATAPASSEVGEAAPVAASRGTPVGAAKLDTIALLERAGRPREVSGRVGAAIVLGLSLVTGLVTYGVRTRGGPPARAEAAAAGESGGARGDAGVDQRTDAGDRF
jgi:eukaryotic-like serine/threonine-protein kinase